MFYLLFIPYLFSFLSYQEQHKRYIRTEDFSPFDPPGSIPGGGKLRGDARRWYRGFERSG